MPQAPSITFLWVASRISNGGTIAPPGSASILRAPPVSLSTRSAKNFKPSCVVEDGGTADWILSVRDCWASAGPAAASLAVVAAISAIRCSESFLMVCFLPCWSANGLLWQSARQGTASDIDQPERFRPTAGIHNRWPKEPSEAWLRRRGGLGRAMMAPCVPPTLARPSQEPGFKKGSNHAPLADHGCRHREHGPGGR